MVNLRKALNGGLQCSASFPQSPDEAMSLAMQMKELRMYQKAGSRILALDGGSMRGLVQLEILC